MFPRPEHRALMIDVLLVGVSRISLAAALFPLSQRLVAGPHSRSFQNDGFDSRLAWRSTYGVPSSWVVWAIMDHALYCIAFQNLSPTRACIGSDIACCLQCWTESMVALLKYNAPHPVSYCAFPFFFFSSSQSGASVVGSYTA